MWILEPKMSETVSAASGTNFQTTSRNQSSPSRTQMPKKSCGLPSPAPPAPPLNSRTLRNVRSKTVFKYSPEWEASISEEKKELRCASGWIRKKWPPAKSLQLTFELFSLGKTWSFPLARSRAKNAPSASLPEGAWINPMSMQT